jgi:hypothetical protein
MYEPVFITLSYSGSRIEHGVSSRIFAFGVFADELINFGPLIRITWFTTLIPSFIKEDTSYLVCPI